jgi:hypothetical protein
MADFTDIVTEFSTIATAQTGINSFKYGNPDEINTSRQNTKPLLILHKQRAVTYPDFQKNLKTFEVSFGIYDTYFEEQKASKVYADKQQDLLNLMEHFLREFRSRSLGNTTEVTSVQEWHMPSNDEDKITINFVEVVGVDKLAGVEATISLTIFSDCDTGTFSY